MDTLPTPNIFDPKAWGRAYNNAELDPKLKAIQGAMEKTIGQSGQDVKTGGMEQMAEYWEMQEQQELDLIRAEMGDETFVYMRGENSEIRKDIAEGIDSWIVFQNQLRAYKEKGDYKSLNMLLSIFGDESFLKKREEKRLEKVEDNGGKHYTEDHWYDPTPGKLLEVKRGHQFDLQPGIIDFRIYVENGSLDIESAINKVLSLLPPVDDISFDQNQSIGHTFQNIRRKFGDDVALDFHQKLQERYFKR